MKLTRFYSAVFTVTLMSLVFVHQQIEIIKQGYKMQSSQKQFNELLDQNSMLEYNVIALKSPHILESRLASSNIQMVLPERWQVVRVASTGIREESGSGEKTKPLLYSFFKFFTFSKEAQANPAN